MLEGRELPEGVPYHEVVEKDVVEKGVVENVVVI